jgi:hypothetical protein
MPAKHDAVFEAAQAVAKAVAKAKKEDAKELVDAFVVLVNTIVWSD